MQSFFAVSSGSRDLSLIHRNQLCLMLFLILLPSSSVVSQSVADVSTAFQNVVSENENKIPNPEEWIPIKSRIKSKTESGDMKWRRMEPQIRKLYTRFQRKSIHYGGAKCLSRGDHYHDSITVDQVHDDEAGKVNYVTKITKTTSRPFTRLRSTSGPQSHTDSGSDTRRWKRSNIHESAAAGDGVRSKFISPKQQQEYPINSINWTSNPSVIQIECFCKRTHRLIVQPYERVLLHSPQQTDHREKSSHVYLEIHTKPCNNSQSASDDHMTATTTGICLMDMSLLTMHDWISGLLFEPLDSHVRLRDGFEPNAPILSSSPGHSFLIHLSTDFMRIESDQESIIRTQIQLTRKTNWESWIAFYLLAFASGLSILCILLSFLYLNLSRRKNSRATTTTSPGSNSDNCPSSLSDMGDGEDGEQQQRRGRTFECFEMSDYHHTTGDKDDPNALISECDASTLTSIPLTSSSTVL